jgi:ketosteroid isomerase-like protein
MIGNSLDSNDCAQLAALEDKTGKIQDLWRVAMYRLSNIAPGLIAAFGLATPAIAADSTQSVEDEIRRLEKESNAAYAANDLDKYFGYYADDLSAIFYDARTTLPEYRKFWTEYVRTAKQVIVSEKLTDMKIRIAPAGDTAIASYQVDLKSRLAGNRITSEHAFETDIWFKRDGVWKLVHVQYSLKTPAPE